MKTQKHIIQSCNVNLVSNFYNIEDSRYVSVILTGDSRKGTRSSSWPPLIDGLLKNQISVIAFDFLSQGESEGDRRDLTLSVGISNFADVLQYYISKGVLSEKKVVYVIASSFGASVLLNSTEYLPMFQKIVLKSPPLDLAMAYENDEGGLQKVREWREKGISENSGLAFDAYLDALKYNPFKNAHLITQPLLIIQGKDDEIVSHALTKRFAFLCEPHSKTLFLDGVRHSYKQNNGLQLFIHYTLVFLQGQE